MNSEETQPILDQDNVPVEPATPYVETLSSNKWWKDWKFIIGVGIVPVIILVFSAFRSVNNSPTQTTDSISKPAPVTLNLTRGNLTDIKGSNITVNVYGNSKTFSIVSTKDVNKIVSGTVAAGDARTGPATISELKVGQEILVIADIGSFEAKSLYILR